MSIAFNLQYYPIALDCDWTDWFLAQLTQSCRSVVSPKCTEVMIAIEISLQLQTPGLWQETGSKYLVLADNLLFLAHKRLPRLEKIQERTVTSAANTNIRQTTSSSRETTWLDCPRMSLSQLANQLVSEMFNMSLPKEKWRGLFIDNTAKYTLLEQNTLRQGGKNGEKWMSSIHLNVLCKCTLAKTAPQQVVLGPG